MLDGIQKGMVLRKLLFSSIEGGKAFTHNLKLSDGSSVTIYLYKGNEKDPVQISARTRIRVTVEVRRVHCRDDGSLLAMAVPKVRSQRCCA